MRIVVRCALGAGILALCLSLSLAGETQAQITLPPIQLPDKPRDEISDPLKEILKDQRLEMLDVNWNVATIRCRGDSGFPISLFQKNTERAVRADERRPWRLGFQFVPTLEGYNRRVLKNGECALPDAPIFGRSFTPPPGEPVYRIFHLIEEPRNRPIRKINFDETGQFYTSIAAADQLIDLFGKNRYVDELPNRRRVEKSARFFDLQVIKEPKDTSLLNAPISTWVDPKRDIEFATEGAAKYNLYIMEIVEIHDE